MDTFWGIVGTVLALIAIGAGVAVAESNSGEFWVARALFALSALIIAGYLMWWLETTDYSIYVRLSVSVILGVSLFVGFSELLRWVDGKEQKIIARQTHEIATKEEVLSSFTASAGFLATPPLSMIRYQSWKVVIFENDQLKFYAFAKSASMTEWGQITVDFELAPYADDIGKKPISDFKTITSIFIEPNNHDLPNGLDISGGRLGITINGKYILRIQIPPQKVQDGFFRIDNVQDASVSSGLDTIPDKLPSEPPQK